MKSNFLLLAAISLVIISCKNEKSSVAEKSEFISSVDSSDRTNDFYDNEPTVFLPGPATIEINGEVELPVRVTLADLPVRTLIVKETKLDQEEIKFVGAYRYDGVSMFDILNQVKVVKKNAQEFNPIIDQYVVVYNAAGDSVVFSWGEIFYPVNLHQVLFANAVTRIVPTKSRDKWPLPTVSRLVVGTDLVTERNIPDPVRIVIRSMNVNYRVDRSIKLWAPEVSLTGMSTAPIIMRELPVGLENQSFEHVFYGRGMGIHGITETKGAGLKDVLSGTLKTNKGLIKNGLIAIAGVDGYRCAVSWSELMNRNDRAEVIMDDRGHDSDGGRFSCLFAADFFSDRAIKSIRTIELIQGSGH